MFPKKNILLICYFYPPLVDVGCRRSIAFSKYFAKYGWTPYVLSVKNPDRTFCTVGSEDPPLNIHTEYSFSIINVYYVISKINALWFKVLRLFNIGLKRNYFYDLFCIPDLYWGWIPLTTIKAVRLIKKYKISLIYVSCAPFSSAIIGILLKHLTRKPLILDFRDPLAFNSAYYDTCPRFRRVLDQKIEKWMVKRADMLFVTSEELRENYLSIYPDQLQKIFTIHNGFEPAFLPQVLPGKYSKFTIVYAGDFYHGVHSLEIVTYVFFEALRRLKMSGKLSSSNFQFLYYGESMGSVRQIASDYSVGELVFGNPSIPHSKVLSVISRSHLQLIRIIPPMIRTSLFEGIALNIPLLALIPPGECQRIIKRYSPSSYVISDRLPDTAADAINDAMNKYANGHIQDNYVDSFLEDFSRENLAVKFMKTVEAKLFS